MSKLLTLAVLTAAIAWPAMVSAQPQPEPQPEPEPLWVEEHNQAQGEAKRRLEEQLRDLAEQQRGLAEARIHFAMPQMKTEKAPWLGVRTSQLPQSMRQHLKLQNKYVGLLVEHVEPDSPASEAGLEKFDIIEKVDDQWIVNTQQFSAVLRMRQAGDQVVIAVIRSGRPQQVNAKLVEKDLPALMIGGVGDFDIQMVPLPPGGFGVGFGEAQGGVIVRRGQLAPLLVDKWPQAGEGTMEVKYPQHTLKLLTKDGKRTLIASDANGIVIYEGPLDTEDDLASVPDEIRDKVKKLDGVPGVGSLFDEPATRPAQRE